MKEREIIQALHDAGLLNQPWTQWEKAERIVKKHLKAIRTEAAAEMNERAAEVARKDAEAQQPYSWLTRQTAERIEKKILALSPDPDYSARIRRDVLEEAARECDQEAFTWQREFTHGNKADTNNIRAQQAKECAELIRALKDKTRCLTNP